MSFAASFAYAGKPQLDRVRGNGAALEHVSIVFDGRLHNRRALEAAYSLGPGESDAALALHAYIRDCATFPESLTGEFALAVFDASDGTLLCARDHAGVRPFYWFDDGVAFHCASELDDFFTLPRFGPAPNEGYIAEWLASHITTRTDTLYRGISRLPPASRMRIASNGPSAPETYWKIDFDRTVRHRSDDEYAEAFRQVFAEAVRCRLDGRLAAVALSGGVDSTSIAGMARSLGKDVEAYSLVFDEAAADERVYVDASVAMFGARSHRFAPTEYDVESFARRARGLRQPPPLPNGYMTSALLHEARANGVRMLMTGLGGDDWFDSVSPALVAADRLRAGHPAEALRGGGVRRVLAGARVIAASVWRRAPSPAGRMVDALRRGRDVPPWVNRSFAARVELRDRVAPHAVDARGFVASAMERRLLHGWQTFAVESEWDAANRIGIELTHPFFDRRVIEFAAALPEEQRARNGSNKFVVRNAMRGLIPESVRTRATKGEFIHLFPRALERIDAAAMMQKMRISDLGWVDEHRLRAGYEELQRLAREGKPYYHLAWPIWMAVSLEAWARENV